VEYRLDWFFGPGAGGALAAAAVGAGTAAGGDSRDGPTTRFSAAPKSGMADSEPKSSAPNWRLSPGMSAEPGISTAVEGIWRVAGTGSTHWAVEPLHTEA